MRVAIQWTIAGILLCSPISAAKSVPDKIRALSAKNYFEVVKASLSTKYSAETIQGIRKSLEEERQHEIDRLDSDHDRLKDEEESLFENLKKLNSMASRDTNEMARKREDLHCRILQVEEGMRQTEADRLLIVPAVFDNRIVKLDILRSWPHTLDQVERTIAAGNARQRPDGNAEDIGIRQFGGGQQKDIKLGMDGIREMRARGLLRPILDDARVTRYIDGLAHQLAENSDLRAPLEIQILQSDQVNSLAFPGGFVFLTTGLIESTASEAELASVIAHEMAHVIARHGDRLTKPTHSVKSMFLEGAQVAVSVFTGGASSLAARYAREYDILGPVQQLNLALLGISHETEAEADQLCVQYLWRAGFDSKSFLTFYDRLAERADEVNVANFFHTHPPSYARLSTYLSEIEYLPPSNRTYKSNNGEFRASQQRLRKLRAASQLVKNHRLFLPKACEE
jgi:Zn-dependent protease with chaperone function